MMIKNNVKALLFHIAVVTIYYILVRKNCLIDFPVVLSFLIILTIFCMYIGFGYLILSSPKSKWKSLLSVSGVIIIGIIIWTISFIGTSTSEMNYDFIRPNYGDDGFTVYWWEAHDKSWIYYECYSFPFIYIALPIIMIFPNMDFELFDIVSLSAVFMAGLFFWIGIILHDRLHKANNSEKLLHKRN
jgi:hypothetical protein